MLVDLSKAFDSINRRKMEQLLLAYGLPKETVTTLLMLYKNTKAIVFSPDGDINLFDIVAGILQRDIFASFFIIFLDNVFRTSLHVIKENDITHTKKG